jgi:ureidoglycolate lyase
MRTVRVEPLSVEGFAPFGDVVSAGLRAGQSANQGTAVRFDWCTELVNARPDARANVSVFRSTAKGLPLELTLLEQHPCSTQAFLPMVCQRFLVCVAPTDEAGAPALDGLRAFVCGPGQGVNYRVGTWHHPIIALGHDADFVMLAFEDGSPRDCVVRPLAAAVQVVG